MTAVPPACSGVQTFHWTPEHVAGIAPGDAAAPVFRRAARVLPGIDLWDHWPVTDRRGRIVQFAGGPLVVALTAPVLHDPELRHGMARLRLAQITEDGWRDFGHLLPETLNPGSREWAGTTILEDDGTTLSLYYTAAGVRGEAETGYLQRLIQLRGRFAVVDGKPRVTQWSCPRELVVPDDKLYQADLIGGGEVGTIKAFRDPAPFVDPANGKEYLLFTASQAQSASRWNGVIGHARRTESGWELLPPLVDAVGLNNELERPHIVVHGGRLLLFWSTQAKVFAPDGPIGPTGLYGLTADRIAGPWRPLNGTGLVIANPPEAPFQAYSWLVNADLSVWSFADLVGRATPPESVAAARQAFLGTPAPVLQLAIDGDRATIIS
ncbi:glycoside hydrolase family 68 protein [Sphingomonas sp. RS6]